MKRLRKFVKNILQSWRIFKRRNLKKNIKKNIREEEMFQDVLAKYEIHYDKNNKNHEINMELITNEINGIILLPNETFSFNENIGERTEEKGFKNGPIYIRGKIIEDLAGGICQAVTGIYNVAILSNLKIIERKAHSRIQKVAPAGRDATVYWGLIDMIFKNNRKSPIKLRILLNKESGIHVFEILGRNVENINVEIKTKKKENRKYIVVKTYREIYKEGRVIKKEILSKDKYKRD